MLDFKYKSTFASAVKCAVSEEKDLILAKASLDELKKSIPDFPQNNDAFLPVAFPAFVANRVNKNDDVIDTKTALAIYQKFIHNPTNIEHKRHNVVGVIVAAGFTEFGTDKPLSYEHVKNMTGPFVVTLGAVVWKVINPEFADLLEEANDPTSDDFMSISASWELGFQEYNIVELDKNQKNIFGGKIISDASEVEKISKVLRINGGTGVLDNKRIYRRPTSDVFPLGIGFTQKPAADVKGVAVEKTDDKIDINSDAALNGVPAYDFYFCPNCQKDIPKGSKSLVINPYGHIECPQCHTTSPTAQWTNKPSKTNPKLKDDNKKGGNISPNDVIKDVNEKTAITKADEKIDKNGNLISQSKNNIVIIERIQKLMFNSIKEITDEKIKEAVASQVAIATPIAELVSAEIKKGNEIWLAEKNQFITQKQEVDSKLSNANQEIEKNQKALKELQATVEQLQKEKNEKEAVEKFNTRMSQVMAAYEFDEEQSSEIAAELRELKSDEEFTKWETKAKKLFKPFQKKDKKDSKDDGKDDTDKAKADDDMEAKKSKGGEANPLGQEAKAAVIDTAIDNAKKDAGIPNTQSAQTQTLKEKYQAAFAMDGFVIKSR